MVVCLRCLLHHILSLIVHPLRENREFVFISIVQFMMSANNQIRFGLKIVFVCLYITPSYYHHCANFIWRHWTYQMPLRYNLSSVWVRLSIFSQLSIIQYVWLCVLSLPISFVMTERIYILCLIIMIKSEVWTIAHCLGLGHETMVCAVCLSIFLSICDMAGLLRGTFVSWWYLPRIGPPVTDMQHYYHARYPTDDWHLVYVFLLVYFSVEVCLEDVFPHFVSTRRDPCVRVYAPLKLATPLPRQKTKSDRGDPALHLHQARGHLTHGSACIIGW